MILSLADHDTLVAVGGGAAGNWSFTQNAALLRFALDFPEFTNAQRWFDTGCAPVIRRLNTVTIGPAGGTRS